MIKLKNILQSKYIYLLLFLIVIISIIRINKEEIIYKNNIEGVVKNVVKLSDRVDIYINDVIAYSYSDIDVKVGSLIRISGEYKIPSKNTSFNLFNYQNYLRGNGIKYKIAIKEYNIINNKENIFYKIKNKIINLINKNNNKKYLNAFILGDKTNIDEEVKTSFTNNGISHLFSISGMHVSLLSGIILLIFNKIKKQDINYLIVFILLLFYSFLVNNTPSILRSVYFFLLCFINKKTVKISNDYLLLYLFIVFIIINPAYLLNIGFLYSFSISYFLIKYGMIINNKSYLIKLLLTSYISFISSLPISINTNFKINILSIFNNIIFVPLVSLIIFPLSLLTLLFPILSPLLSILTNLLEELSLLMSNVSINIIMCHIPWYIIVFYYLVIFLILEKLKQKKYKYVLLIYIIIIFHTLLLPLNFINKIHFIDVDQGDSILLQIKNKAILIDTGGIKNKSLAKNIHSPYLNSLGIKKLDYLILTHGDYDHMGEAINLVNNFKVDKVIFNCGPYNDLEEELIKVLDKKKIKHYSCIKKLNIDKNKLYFLQTKEYDNENDNSNVIYTELDGYKFMFMGDASITTEKEIIDKYNLQGIDVLKVGHHGSKTSSGKEFINEINPKYSIISVGKNNRYGHPSKEVLDNLEDSKIYRTDINGSIMFKIKNNKLKIETCSP